MATLTSPSVSLQDVVDTIAFSFDGDTVVIPAGSATWTSGLNLTKAITLRGNGIGSTIILNGITTSGNSPLLKVTSAANKNTRITGLDLGNSGGTVQTNGVIQLIGSSSNNSTIRFDNCKLNRLNGVSIQTYNVIGVIDHCAFISRYGVMIDVQDTAWGGVGLYGDNSWALPSGFGTGQFLFIEDNSFDGTSVSTSVDSINGARYVFRHNGVLNSDFGGHGTESGSRFRGMRAIEAYNNTFSGTIPGWNVSFIRSGVAVIHDNTLTGWPGNTSPPVWNLYCYRMFNNFSPWGAADGTNQWDINQGGGPFYTGTVSSSTGLTVTLSGTPFTTNQWRGYSIKKTSGSASGQQFSEIFSNTTSKITFSDNGGYAGGNLTFNAGDTFAIYKVTQALDQPGVSGGSLISGASPVPPAGWNNQTVEACYQWNNTYALPGGGTAPINFAAHDVNIHAGTHYFDGTPMPGYTPYTYPHPLTLGLTASITNPVDGNFVSGTINVSASATAAQNLSVVGVQFKLDGSNLGAEVLSAPYSVLWLTTSAINGSHNISAVARDTGGNTYTASTIAVSVNNNVAPPVISAVNTSGVTDLAATVNWTTDTASDSQVFYGTTTAYGSNTTLNAALVTSHSQTVTGLSAGTTYHFQVKSKDAAGNLSTSGDFMFTTSTGADITPPSVSITTPVAGTVSGITTVTATASDNVGVVGVQFLLDGVNLGAEVLSSPYTISWDTKTSTNASHTLTAIARDAAGNKTTSSGVSVTASNAPIISGVGVSAITDTGGTINWTTNQTSDSQVDYGLTSGYGSSSTLNATLVTAHHVNLTGLTPSTTYHFRVESRDAQSLLTTSGDFQFTTAADTTPPTVSITAPTASATVSGSAVTVSATASDDVGVISVQFLVDGVNIGLDSVTPFSITWDTTTLTNGTHVLTAIAKDGANNQTTSAPISVTVSNAPIISAVNPSAISSGGATIQWATNHGSDSKINYGLTSGYGSNTTLDSTLVTSHGQTLSGLSPSTNYHFEVLSRDAQGNLTTSGDFIFQTTASGGDTTPPTISITAPPNSTIVSGTVIVSATATDNVGVGGVQFKLDGVNLLSQVTVAPYSILWNTRQSLDGSHTLGAVATDTSGNTTSAATVTVTVSNAPGGKGRKKKLLI